MTICKRHGFWQKQYSLSKDSYVKLKTLHDKNCLIPLANKTQEYRKGI
jgi:hypothetical protein